MKVNRFPKMAAIQKYRALKLGYPEDKAEAIGIAEALKYAIFKRLAHSEKRYHQIEEREKKPEIQLDWDTFKTFKIAAYNGWPIVAGKVETPEDYKKEIYWKWGDKIGKKIEQWAKNIIKKVPKEYLENEQKFFREVWVPHRDEPIE